MVMVAVVGAPGSGSRQERVSVCVSVAGKDQCSVPLRVRTHGHG